MKSYHYEGQRTLVEDILVLLALGTASSHVVDLVHEATASLGGRSLVLVLALALARLVIAASGSLLEEIHAVIKDVCVMEVVVVTCLRM